jgi:hypothetical protein
MTDFSNIKYLKAIILYGLNNATYKIALGRSLLDFSQKGASLISWQELSKSFLDHYIERLELKMLCLNKPIRLALLLWNGS